MKKIGVLPNLLRDKDLNITQKIIHWLEANGLQVYTNIFIARKLKRPELGIEEISLYSTCDMLIAIGGDGTLLGAAQKACVHETPILGINSGRLGFLAEVEAKEALNLLQGLLQEKWELEKRMMIEVHVVDPEGQESVFHGLNDITLIRGSSSRVTEFEIHINQKHVDIYPADGIIVSTPTGSTAYNLSAGGPIVMPYAKNLIVTPICPHTIYARALVLDYLDVVHIKTHNSSGTQLELVVDGQVVAYITPHHTIEIKKSPYETHLIKLSGLDFFEILRNKMVERRK
jgi:NAD+ kinase